MSVNKDVPTKVWRYMPFSRYVWLLQKKQLWLTRVELLEDPWEGHLTPEQRNFVIARHPPTTLGQGPTGPSESAVERIARITRWHRSRTFVSCWTASDHESHALWKIFCPTEGVVIQTTLDQLRKSVGPLHVRFVNYAPIGNRTPNVNDMVIQKRPMFAYEQEVRVVLVYDHKDEATKPKRETFGSPIGWDPELHVETVRVNPGADHSFIETVTEVTKTYAPALTERVFYSEMATRPE